MAEIGSPRAIVSDDVPDGELLVYDHAAMIEVIGRVLRLPADERDEAMRREAARMVALGQAVKVTGIA